MYAFTQMILAVALAGVAALAASEPAKAVPTNGTGRFYCVKDDLEVSTIAGPGAGDLSRQGFTCAPLRAL